MNTSIIFWILVITLVVLYAFCVIPVPTMRRIYYRKVYLNSSHWKKTRKLALARSGYRCEHSSRLCHGVLDVHHLTYNNIGHENPSDLIVLCRYHHEQIHRRK